MSRSLPLRLLAVLGVTLTLGGLATMPALGQCDHFYTGPDIDPDPNTPESVALGDLNGDDILDLAVSYVAIHDSAYKVSVFTGVGDGTFVDEVDYVVGDTPEEVVMGELDGQPGLDLVVVCYGDLSTSILLNDGSGGFTVSTIPAEFGYRAAIGDLNGDFVNDVAISHPDNDTISLWLNNGDGTFTAGEVITTLITVPAGIGIGDMDGVNGNDIIVSGVPFSIEQLLNNGDGTFTQETHGLGGSYTFGLTLGDGDGDGDLDIALPHWWGGAAATVMLNNGDGTYVASTYGTGGWAAEHAAFADLDGVGGPEFIVVDNGTTGSGTVGQLSVWTGDGAGGFSDRCGYETAEGSTGLALGDVNGDGWTDAVVASYLDGVCTVLLNTATGPSCPADIDGDGDTDLSDLAALLASYNLCDGDPGFEPAADYDDSGCVTLSDLAFLLADYLCGT